MIGEVVVHLHRLRVLRSISVHDVFHVRGRPVFVGGFAVVKKGKPLKGSLRVTRFIINMIPTNSYMRTIVDGLGSLNPARAGLPLFLVMAM
jgi:hypothetical protein